MSLSIVGVRGVGKSNVARRVALLTKRPVVSTDVLVSYESGLTIPDFVARYGWREFRDLEHTILRKLTALADVVVDCGGGIVVDLDDDGTEAFSQRNVAVLKRLGPVVWLQGDLERLAVKTADDPTRPALDAQRSALQTMTLRAPCYERAADLVVDVEGRRRSEIASEIVEWEAASRRAR